MEGYPNSKLRYWLEVGGMLVGAFMEVSGFDAQDGQIASLGRGLYSVAAVPESAKMPASRKHGNILLRRGMVEGRVLYDWLASGIAGEVQPKSVIIRQVDGCREEVAAWKAYHAWPTTYTAPDFNATSGWIAVETLELAHDGVARDG